MKFVIGPHLDVQLIKQPSQKKKISRNPVLKPFSVNHLSISPDAEGSAFSYLCCVCALGDL